MLKSLSFIRSMFSSAKRSKLDMDALSPRVRNIQAINSREKEPYCIAYCIHQKGKPAEIISITKKDSLIVDKTTLDLGVNPPSPLPTLQAILACITRAESIGMKDFPLYFSNKTILNMSYCNIQNPALFALHRDIGHRL